MQKSLDNDLSRHLVNKGMRRPPVIAPLGVCLISPEFFRHTKM
ncbi:hypothetical protein CLV36_11155 [Laceyella sediminis]|uniref:Uncharacterized protein n=2 Tax=Laceyella TaxID=292635 RepID=A0AA45WNM3_9BACL|nr:hypothetical protein CLV36_11155 [Laceyella sediminis]SMP18783.1 hypothetical protein SAMN06265361_103212 [Laceyella tengchongensis]